MPRMRRHAILSVWLLTVMLTAASAVALAENIDPDNVGSQFAWGENIGWINFDPLGDGGSGVEVSDSALTGYAWGENIGWINLSPASGGGVVNDGAGHLSGSAWGENVGWINFAPTGGGVTINRNNGVFFGYAWGENVGWINVAPTGGGVTTSWRGSGINQPPAADPQAVATLEDTPMGITLTGNDPDGDPLIFSIATPPANGTLIGAPPNPTYTPNSNFNGSDSFTFQVFDGAASSLPAEVSITVAPVNDPPVPTAPAITTAEDTAGTSQASPHDPDAGDTHTYAISAAPTHGTALVDAAGLVTYTPNPNYSGPDSLRVTVTDAAGAAGSVTLPVTVTPVNDDPPSLTGIIGDRTVDEGQLLQFTVNAADPDGDPLVFSATGLPPGAALDPATGAFSYTPGSDVSAPFSNSFFDVIFEVSDGLGGADNETVRITVADVTALYRVSTQFDVGGVCARNPGFDVSADTPVQAGSGVLECVSGFAEASALAGKGMLVSSVDISETGFGGTGMGIQASFDVPFMLLSDTETTASIALNLVLAGQPVTNVTNLQTHGWTVLVTASLDNGTFAQGAQRANGNNTGFAIPFPDGAPHAFNTNGVVVTTNTPHTLRLEMIVGASVSEFGGRVSLADTTLTLATTGPVFILPEGVTLADIPALNIVGNRWIDPRLPPAEVCDGLDNDLDGQTDEGFPNTDGDLLADCIDPDDDNDGVPDIDEIAAGSDPLNAASIPEVCDGVDNDLDGQTDEGFADTDGDGQADCVDSDDDNDTFSDATEVAAGSNPLNAASTPEVCDGLDNDLGGLVDEGFPDTDGDGVADCVDVIPVPDTTAPVIEGHADVMAEAASAAGAVVSYTSPATSDAVDGAGVAACLPVAGSTFPLGDTTVACNAADAAGNAAAPTTFVVHVVDSTPPVVTPPAGITVPATEAGGARGSASAVLAGFLLSGSAVDAVDPSPSRLAPQVAGVDADNTMLFPIGTTPVTFRFTDAAGNIGTAAANVTVAMGTPKLSGKIIAKGRDVSGAYFVDLQLTDIGTGHARNTIITLLTFRTLSGSGTVSYNTILSPALPLTIGSLDKGTSTTTRLYLNVPSTVTRFSITENGTVQDVAGTVFTYSIGQAVIP